MTNSDEADIFAARYFCLYDGLCGSSRYGVRIDVCRIVSRMKMLEDGDGQVSIYIII